MIGIDVSDLSDLIGSAAHALQVQHPTLHESMSVAVDIEQTDLQFEMESTSYNVDKLEVIYIDDITPHPIALLTPGSVPCLQNIEQLCQTPPD